MHLKLSLSLLTATAWLASAGPISPRRFDSGKCNSADLGCNVLTSSGSLNTPIETVPINIATIDGHDYYITGSEAERMQIMTDLLDLPAEEFAAKWASKYRGPTTDDI
ncbi:uncharacterized protein B0T23DRAFT_425569 [Neurospora hispaniola]|uniref:Uncharacterized protein n=1 Tax=Neurospora hispaniola TaxID=588809 RepID=A0AAJ0IHC6_9PEZI|nr:hypothetical protein B0T23DRAFT_425569 [Neurospora hispaniola]